MFKSAVEDYKSISIKWLKDRGYLRGEAWQKGPFISHLSIQWTRGGQPSGSVGAQINLELGCYGTMRLKYTFMDYRNAEEKIAYDVQLVATPCRFGGVRWWFLCPLSRGGVACRRRVSILYLGKYAGCRNCHDLIYQSSKNSHKFDGIAKMMNIDPRILTMFSRGDLS